METHKSQPEEAVVVDFPPLVPSKWLITRHFLLRREKNFVVLLLASNAPYILVHIDFLISKMKHHRMAILKWS